MTQNKQDVLEAHYAQLLICAATQLVLNYAEKEDLQAATTALIARAVELRCSQQNTPCRVVFLNKIT